MIFEEEKYTLGKRDIVLRSAHEDEADMLIDYNNVRKKPFR